MVDFRIAGTQFSAQALPVSALEILQGGEAAA